MGCEVDHGWVGRKKMEELKGGEEAGRQVDGLVEMDGWADLERRDVK